MKRKRSLSFQFLFIGVLTIALLVIVRIHQVYAANGEAQSHIASSKASTEFQILSQSSGQVARPELADRSWQTELSSSVRQPSPYKPTIVYVRLNTISQINLPDETYNVSANWNS